MLLNEPDPVTLVTDPMSGIVTDAVIKIK